MRALLAAGLVVGLVAAPSAAEETMHLAWKWEKGAKFELSAESRTDARTVMTSEDMEPVTEVETETKSHRIEVEVRDVLEDGRAQIVLRWREVRVEQSAPGRKVSFHVFEDSRGRPDSTVDVSIPALGSAEDSFSKLLAIMVKSLLLFRVHVELSRTGEVLSAKSEGGLFGSAGAQSQSARLAESLVGRIVSADDIAQTAAGEVFPQLPAGPSAPTARWPARRAFSAFGIAMRGKGAAFVTKFEPGGAAVALGEEMIYDLDSKQFSKTMQESLAAALPGGKVTASLAAEARPLVRYAGRFDVAAGHPLEWGVPKLELKLIGTVNMSIGKVKRAMRMKIGVIGTSTCVWKRQ